MAEIRWIKTSSFLMLLLHFTAVTGQYSSFLVLDGDEVTLPCENVIDGQDKCDRTNWRFTDSGYTAAVQLVRRGQIGENAKAKSDRLSVTASCSLVIKKVTAEDVGHYTCRQLRSGRQDADVYLSVVTMTEHEDPDKVTFTCSVSTYVGCRHTVKWLYEGKDVDKDNKDMKTSQSDCTVTVTFLTSYVKQKSKYQELFKCEVTDIYSGKVQRFPFSPQSSVFNLSGGDATATQEDCSALSYIMLVMRVAELVLITAITVLLIRARGA
ncbi:uncharacterized protein LOC122863080 isoform X2 [Siniperca chuatsi]|uniref:uncharacterized protein LOC122863080 isoform X2 n=1 Tax=Siniperca chuatsi TaxID=119488 RepID=UPI001CE108FF|nr:uncharacterized protein LOC122863080 isoform X2 [Siniperca chuatsi]